MAAVCKGLEVSPLAIFTGDFNSTPDSAVYSFVRDGELDCYMEDRRNLSGQLETDEKGWPPSGLINARALNIESPFSSMDRKRVGLLS